MNLAETCICYFLLSSFIITADCWNNHIRLFTPNWVSDGNCSNIGLFYRCCGNGTEECQIDDDSTYLNKPALISEAIAFVIHILFPITLRLILIFVRSKQDASNAIIDSGLLRVVCFVVIISIYPFSGWLIINGCNLVREDHPESLGYSIYFCSVAAMLTSFQTSILYMFCFVLLRKRQLLSDFLLAPCPSPQLVRPKESLMNFINRISYTKVVGKIEVKVIVGRIAEQKVDVIVNSTSSNLQLNNRPGLSKSLLRKAGQSLQDECDTEYPNGIEPETIAITNGHNLNCQKVFHGSIPCWYSKPVGNRMPENVFSGFVRKCLDKAEESNFKSIAFPALGTGFLKYPIDIAVTKMIKSIRDYEKERQNNCIKEIRIVIYPGSYDWTDIKKEFVDQLRGVKPTVNATMQPITEGKMPSRKTKEFLVYKYYEKVHTPQYWTYFHCGISLKDWNLNHKGQPFKFLDVDKKTYKQISNVFMATRGGCSIVPPNIVNIQRIENINLYEKYQRECQRLFRKAAADGKITSIKKTKLSSGNVATTKHINTLLSDNLYPEINEHYFFHGTKADLVDLIVCQGFDSRLAMGGRVGYGIYGAELSAKAAAYAEENGNGECKMFLLRMCLGEVFVTNEHVDFRRPPCKQCDKEVCFDHTELYDSVMADGGDFENREFVVYDSHQCYPEYVITFNKLY